MEEAIEEGCEQTEKDVPHPENAIWIAAMAQRYNLTLVSRDSHFEAIDQLEVEPW